MVRGRFAVDHARRGLAAGRAFMNHFPSSNFTRMNLHAGRAGTKRRRAKEGQAPGVGGKQRVGIWGLALGTGRSRTSNTKSLFFNWLLTIAR